MFCKHKWELVSETITKSKFQSSIDALVSAGGNATTTLPHQLCCADRKLVQIVACEKCGKLKRWVENL